VVGISAAFSVSVPMGTRGGGIGVIRTTHINLTTRAHTMVRMLTTRNRSNRRRNIKALTDQSVEA
jgi:hypothetical protein